MPWYVQRTIFSKSGAERRPKRDAAVALKDGLHPAGAEALRRHPPRPRSLREVAHDVRPFLERARRNEGTQDIAQPDADCIHEMTSSVLEIYEES